MRKILIIFYLTVFASLSNAFSQVIEKKSFALNSLEDKPTNINVEWDIVNNKITIALTPSEAFCISGYVPDERVEKMEILDKRFLLLSFRTRGGTGIGLGQTILICVSNGHLYKALNIIASEDYYFTKTYNKEVDAQAMYDESEKYRVHIISIQESKKSNYKLTVTQYDKVKSKYNPNTNHETLDTLRFNFDEKNKVFYDKYILLNGSYTVIDNPQKNKQMDFSGQKYPGIEGITRKGLFYGNEYIYTYINGIWYTLTNKNQLVKEWDICN